MPEAEPNPNPNPGGDPPAPAAPPAPAPGADSWATGLAPEHKSLVEAKGWKSPADALTSYAELERTLGANKLAVPDKDAGPEDWDKVYSALGRPEAADKYDLGDFKPPEGLPWNPEVQTAMLGVMHQAGLNSRQAQTLIAGYAETQAKAWQAFNAGQAQALETAQGELRSEWGGKFDEKIELANRVAKHAFGEQLEAARQLQLNDGSFLLDNPLIARAFAAIGEAFAEDGALPKGDAGGLFPASTAEGAKAEIARIRAAAHGDPKHPYHDQRHPEHRALHRRMQELYAVAHPGTTGPA